MKQIVVLPNSLIVVFAKRYKGMIHGFLSMDGFWDKARSGIDEASAALREAFLTP
jgi:acetyl esterase/lipase